MRNFLATAALVASILVPTLSFAAEKPPELATSIKATAPVGAATLRKLMLHVYDASFWSDTKGWSTAPYALSLTYGMHFMPEELADRSYDEMKRVSGLPDEKLKTYQQKLNEVFHEVNDGDRITALATAKNSTTFYYNGVKTGTVTDPDFAQAFFGIWLSPKSSEPELQKKLLGQ